MIHRGALGDLLGAVPSVRALRAAAGGAPVTLLGHPERGRLLQRAGVVDAVHDTHAAALLPLFAGAEPTDETRAFCERFGRCVAWVRDPEGALEAHVRACGVADVVVAEPLGEPGRRAHAEHLAAALEPFGLTAEIPGPPLEVDPADLDAGAEWLRERLGNDGTPVLVIHPGSGSPDKNWPVESFREVGRAVRRTGDARVVVLLGPAECEGPVGEHPWDDHADAVGRSLPLPVLAGVARACTAWLGNDAGTTHLAAMLGVPTVGVFGDASDPIVWAPRVANAAILQGVCGPRSSFDPVEVARVTATLRSLLRS